LGIRNPRNRVSPRPRADIGEGRIYQKG
jgi:hypothetical protein